GAPFGTVLRGLNDAGLKVPVLASGANLDPVQLNQYKTFLPPELDFNALLYFARDTLLRGHLRSVVDDFWNAYATAGARVSPGSGFAWDPGWIVVSALRKLGPNATADQL